MSRFRLAARWQVVAERLLDDDPAPGLVVASGRSRPGLAELLDDRREELGRRRPGSRAGCRASRALASSSSRRSLETLVAGSSKVPPSRRRAVGEAAQAALEVGGSPRRLDSASSSSARSSSSRPVAAGEADDGELAGGGGRRGQLVERGDELAVGQVAGRAEEDDRARLGHALEAQALAQWVRVMSRAPRLVVPASSRLAASCVAGTLLPRGGVVCHVRCRFRRTRANARNRWGASPAPRACRRHKASKRCVTGVGHDPASPTGTHQDLTSCPPNSLRSAASTFAPNDSSWREAKRLSSDSVITGAGTSRSIASGTVQRPSPESCHETA